MANIGTSIKDWSTTATSNQPDSSDSATVAGDLQAIQAGVRGLYSQATVASSGTTDIGANDAGSLTISGTTTITSLGTVSAGIRKKVLFSGILTLTHHGTSLILPSGANITTAANDTAEFESLGSGNWRCNYYVRQTGLALIADADKANLSGATFTGNVLVPADVYDSGWDSDNSVPTKNDVYDEIVKIPTETSIGRVEKATAAEAQAFTADKYLDAALLASAFQGGNQSLAANGYQKLPGGLIIQYGAVATSATGNTVNFPITFNNIFMLNVSASGVSVPVGVYVSVGAYDVSSFNVGCNSGTPVAHWIAIGN